MEREQNTQQSMHTARSSTGIERAILERKPFYGITYDLSKAFDIIPIVVTFGVCKAVGMDERLFVWLKVMYDRI